MTAPVIEAVRSTVPASPVTRSIGVPAAAATCGASAFFAESPGPRRAPARATRARNAPKGRRPASYSSGTDATTSVEARSQPTATRRAPSWSMTGPPRALSSTSGSISARATSPVRVALPVVASTKRGMAIIETRVPVIETVSATSQPTSGRRERVTGRPRGRRGARRR